MLVVAAATRGSDWVSQCLPHGGMCGRSRNLVEEIRSRCGVAYDSTVSHPTEARIVTKMDALTCGVHKTQNTLVLRVPS